MKRVIHDHGAILHWAGFHHVFPVKGPADTDLGFGSHGALEGRTPIGWNEFFPSLAKSRRVVVVDDEAGTATCVAAAETTALPADAKH
jgi:hypothetical protein